MTWPYPHRAQEPKICCSQSPVLAQSNGLHLPAALERARAAACCSGSILTESLCQALAALSSGSSQQGNQTQILGKVPGMHQDRAGGLRALYPTAPCSLRDIGVMHTPFFLTLPRGDVLHKTPPCTLSPIPKDPRELCWPKK